jgi:tetratricopeptide (TPR) repeat protein
MLVPVIGLVQVGAQAMADRYTYLPLVGIFIALTWAACELTIDSRYAKATLAVLGCGALIACAAGTARQLAYWKNTEKLCRHALRVTRENFPAHAALGAYLLEHGKIEEAKSELAETIRLNPQHASAHYLLGGQLARERKFDEAREHLEDAIRAHPTFVEAYIELADIANAQGQGQAGLGHALKALSFASHSSDAHFSAGASLLLQQKFAEALPHYEAAVKEKPGFAEAELDWGKALLQLGRLKEAETHLRRASEFQPNNLEPHRFLAEVYARENRGREQVQEYDQMLRLAPDWPEVLNNLAWLLATQPEAELRNGPRAVMLSQRASALTGQTNYLFLSTLAAAYAEAGDFAEAVATQQEVCKLAEANSGKNATEMFRNRLELYRSEKAYHKPK